MTSSYVTCRIAMGHDSFLWDMTDCYGTYLIPIQHDFFVVCAIKYRTPSRPPHNKSIGKKAKQIKHHRACCCHQTRNTHKPQTKRGYKSCDESLICNMTHQIKKGGNKGKTKPNETEARSHVVSFVDHFPEFFSLALEIFRLHC